MNDNEKYLEKLKTHRRQLHQIPEIDRDLPETKAYLLSVLEQLDCELTFLCGSGICAWFDRGAADTFAFRSDMDGLPVTEASTCDYVSTHPGKMHACGHDGHMAMLLSFSEYIDTVKELDHNVLLIFQPAEETLGGAEEICKSGIFTKYNVSQVFGIHLWPFLPKGVISSRPGAFMPKSAEINVDINGKAAHGTAPYEGLDALYITADYVKRTYGDHANMFGAIHRFKDGVGDLTYAPCDIPEERTLIHFGKMESGYARNIVSDYSHLLGTVRAYDEDHFRKIIGILTKNLEEIEKEYHCTTGFSHSDGYPPVINDKVLYDEIRPVLESLEGGYEEMPLPLMISEDFSFYGQYAPAVFFVLGTGTGIPLHSTSFDFEEDLLLSGFALYKALLTR